MEEQNVYYDQSRRNYYWKINEHMPPIISTLNYNYPLVIPGVTDNGPFFKYPQNYVPFKKAVEKFSNTTNPIFPLQNVENLIQGNTDNVGSISQGQDRNFYKPLYSRIDKEENKRHITQAQFLKEMIPVGNSGSYYRGVRTPVNIGIQPSEKLDPNNYLDSNPIVTNIPLSTIYKKF